MKKKGPDTRQVNIGVVVTNMKERDITQTIFEAAAVRILNEVFGRCRHNMGTVSDIAGYIARSCAAHKSAAGAALDVSERILRQVFHLRLSDVTRAKYSDIFKIIQWAHETERREVKKRQKRISEYNSKKQEDREKGRPKQEIPADQLADIKRIWNTVEPQCEAVYKICDILGRDVTDRTLRTLLGKREMEISE